MTIGYFLLAIALAEFALGFWFIFAYKKSQATIFYGLFALGIAFYVGSNGLGYTHLLISGQLAEKIGWAGASILTASFFAFSFSYPLPKKKPSELFPWLLWPIAFFGSGFLLSNEFVKVPLVSAFGSGYVIHPGSLFWGFIAFFIVYWIWGISNLVRAYQSSDGVHRSAVGLLLFGITISLLVSSTFDIIMPLVSTSRFGYVGSLFSAVWLGFTSYILVKK